MDALAALALQIEWGADEALDAVPIDRLAAPPPPARPVRAAEPVGIAARARIAAEAANTTEALRQALAGFGLCPLAATATNLVFADGNPLAGLVMVAEAPGDDDDRDGRPLAGRTGQFFERMVASIGLTRADMLITSLIPWRPPGGRQPTQTEVQTCLPFLVRHLTLLRPRLVVTLGSLPAKMLTGRGDPLRKLRGRWVDVQVPGLPAAIPALPMLHPAHVQDTPGAKKAAWADLIALRKALDAL